jgi:hypothetical protein
MKLVEHSSNIGWKVDELAWNLHEIKFAIVWSHLIKGVFFLAILILELAPKIPWSIYTVIGI